MDLHRKTLRALNRPTAARTATGSSGQHAVCAASSPRGTTTWQPPGATTQSSSPPPAACATPHGQRTGSSSISDAMACAGVTSASTAGGIVPSGTPAAARHVGQRRSANRAVSRQPRQKMWPQRSAAGRSATASRQSGHIRFSLGLET
jgi:hypothetical protein